MKDTPYSERLHITVFGKMNSGKSSLFNALVGQPLSIVSDVSGTTADTVSKAVEIPGVGPCLLTDTAGFDDICTSLGRERVSKTRKASEKAEIGILLFTDADDVEQEWFSYLQKAGMQVIPVISRADLLDDSALASRIVAVEKICGRRPVVFSASDRRGVSAILDAVRLSVSGRSEEISITGDLVHSGDTVLLVMPQDKEAPKGRLILPQVQTIRELLDKGCTVVCCTAGSLERSLTSLASPPELIITDSQVFSHVWKHKPEASRLTSFSILFAAYKGDIRIFMSGTEKLANLNAGSRVLIAEACSHVPLHEDIGRVRLPELLRKRFGRELSVDIVSGDAFPEDLSSYALVIHCGACMFNRKYVLERISSAVRQGVPVTNYGLALAWLTGILDRVEIPL